MTTEPTDLRERIARRIAARVHIRGEEAWREYEAYAAVVLPIVREAQAEAWEQGAETAWQSTGEGWNGEYAYGHGTHDGSVSWRDAGVVKANPYTEQRTDDE